MELDEMEVERLSKRLSEVMEHLDPVGKRWESMDEHERDYYRVCVQAIVLEYQFPSPFGFPTTT